MRTKPPGNINPTAVQGAFRKRPGLHDNDGTPVTEHSRAVFISYASQDAQAAQRICAALRSAGVDVWFDQERAARRGPGLDKLL